MLYDTPYTLPLTGVAVLQVMGKNKVLVKVHPEGKYVVDLDKSIEMSQARNEIPHPVQQAVSAPS